MAKNKYPTGVLIDTNILLAAYPPSSPRHQDAIASVKALESAGRQLFICPQTMQEFRQVATRPVDKNGLGLTSIQAATLLTAFERRYTMAFETPDVYREWRRIAEAVAALGRSNFDARIVALASVVGLNAVLTFEADAFKRYASLTPVDILDPVQIAAAGSV